MRYCGICGEPEHPEVEYAGVKIRGCPDVPEDFWMEAVPSVDDPAQSLRAWRVRARPA